MSYKQQNNVRVGTLFLFRKPMTINVPGLAWRRGFNLGGLKNFITLKSKLLEPGLVFILIVSQVKYILQNVIW